MEKLDKRSLSKIPRPVVTEELVDDFNESDYRKGLITAQWMEKGVGIIVTTFSADQEVGLKPQYRIFCLLDGDITQDLTTEKTKWKTGTWARLNDEYYYPAFGRSFTDYGPASYVDEDIIKRWVARYKRKRNPKLEVHGDKFNDALNAYQNDIRLRRRVARHQKLLDRIDSRMKLFGDLPADYPEFIENTVFDEENFLFYSRKQKFAYCTHCGSEWTLAMERTMENAGAPYPISIMDLRHNEEAFCPCCGHKVTAKSAGMGRGQMVFVKWSCCVQSSGEDLLVRYIRHIKDFSKDYRNPWRHDFEMFRTFHGEHGQEDFAWDLSYITNTYRWGTSKQSPGCWSWSDYKWPWKTILYNTDWGFLQDTRFRYCCIDLYLKTIVGVMWEHPSPWKADMWFSFYYAYPFAEQLMKVGWYQLVYDLMFREGLEQELRKIKHEKTIYQSLQMTREQFKLLRSVTENHPRIIDLDISWYAAEIGVKLTEEDYRSIRFMCKHREVRLYEKILDLGLYMNLHKVVTWLTKQLDSRVFTLHEYIDDYIMWCKELHVNLRDEYYLLPSNFQKRHDEMYMAYLKEKDHAEYEKRQAYNSFLERMRSEISDDNPKNLHFGGIFIRLPERIEELTKEGEVLHHCVGTYADRVMKGQTTIFFVRKEEEPEIPFYTLEWKDSRMIQCRGMRNCDMTPEVRAFTTVFSEKMQAFENATKTQRRKKARVG